MQIWFTLWSSGNFWPRFGFNRNSTPPSLEQMSRFPLSNQSNAGLFINRCVIEFFASKIGFVNELHLLSDPSDYYSVLCERLAFWPPRLGMLLPSVAGMNMDGMYTLVIRTKRSNPGVYATSKARTKNVSFISPRWEIAPSFFKACWASELHLAIVIRINERAKRASVLNQLRFL